MGFLPDALKAENLSASVHAPLPAIVRLCAVSVQHFLGCFKLSQNNSCIAQKKTSIFKSSDVDAQLVRCFTPAALGKAPATCHGCLLHPPPLVDLARDLTISGFFLFFRRY